jgi:hypothetical protein
MGPFANDKATSAHSTEQLKRTSHGRGIADLGVHRATPIRVHSAVSLRVDLPCAPQDQFLSESEEIGTVALGVFLSADVGVVAGRGQQRRRKLDPRYDLHAARLDGRYSGYALPHLVVVLLGER